MLGIHDQNFLQDLERAEKEYQAAIEADPNYARPRGLLGNLYLNLHRVEEAEKTFEALRERSPQLEEGYLGLGKVRLQQGRWEEAAAALRRAAELDADDPEPHRLLGQTLGRLGKREEAQNALKRYQELNRDADRMTQLQRVVRRNPTRGEGWFNLGREYLRRKQAENAIGALENGLAFAPAVVSMRTLLAALYLQKRQIAPARKHAEIAIEQDPNSADNYNTLGVCLLLEEHYREAVQAFQTAIELGKDVPGVRQNLELARKKQREQEESGHVQSP